MIKYNSELVTFNEFDKLKKLDYYSGMEMYIYYTFLEKEENYIEFRKERPDIKFINKFNKPDSLNNNLIKNFFKMITLGKNKKRLKFFIKLFLEYFKTFYRIYHYNLVEELNKDSIKYLNLINIRSEKINSLKKEINLNNLNEYLLKINLISEDLSEFGNFFNIKYWIYSPFKQTRVGIIFKKKTMIKKAKKKKKKLHLYLYFHMG